MRRIDQLFTLAERYVGAHERYVEETCRRYRETRACEDRNLVNSERMTEAMAAKVRADEDLGPRLADLAGQLAEMVKAIGGLDLEGMKTAIRAALPNSVAPSDAPGGGT